MSKIEKKILLFKYIFEKKGEANSFLPWNILKFEKKKKNTVILLAYSEYIANDSGI